MKQEDKDLLLWYLSMALPYKTKGIITFNGDKDVFTVKGIYDILFLSNTECCRIEDFKPYLRPISSMTIDEDRKRIDLGIWKSNQYDGQIIGIFQDIAYCSPQNFQSALIWLLQNHFDIFGLIPKGLAIAVNEENNPYN